MRPESCRTEHLQSLTRQRLLGLALLLSLVGASVADGDERLKGIACRSVHLGFAAPEGVAFFNEVMIDTSAPGTYFMVCGWNTGYFGLQELDNGKKVVLFSVWDSPQNNPQSVPAEARVRIVHRDERVRIGRFGGEGTGGQCFFDYNWKIGERYALLVRARPDGERTEYAGYFFEPETQRWRHLVTFSRVNGSQLLQGYYSFVEDFRRNRVSATQPRAARFGPAWYQDGEGRWSVIARARFTADSNPVDNINAAVRGQHFLLETGGEVRNTGVKLRQLVELPDPLPTELPSQLKAFPQHP